MSKPISQTTQNPHQPTQRSALIDTTRAALTRHGSLWKSISSPKTFHEEPALSRIRTMISILRILAQSCALEDERRTTIRVQWTGTPPAAEEKTKRINLRPLQDSLPDATWCKRQTRSGKYHVPNYWKNRQRRGGESPNLSNADVPSNEHLLPTLGDLSFDVEAVAYASLYNPAPRRDALKTWQQLFEMSESTGFGPLYRFPEGHTGTKQCGSCEKWEALPDTKNSRRPPGASRDHCNGCIVSHLDVTTSDVDTERDELVTAWMAARERVAQLEQSKSAAQSPEDKDAWQVDRDKAKAELEAASRACKNAGISLNERKRSRTGRIGDVPKHRLERPVVSARIPN